MQKLPKKTIFVLVYTSNRAIQDNFNYKMYCFKLNSICNNLKEWLDSYN